MIPTEEEVIEEFEENEEQCIEAYYDHWSNAIKGYNEFVDSLDSWLLKAKDEDCKKHIINLVSNIRDQIDEVRKDIEDDQLTKLEKILSIRRLLQNEQLIKALIFNYLLN
jgi:hypothetical protein